MGEKMGPKLATGGWLEAGRRGILESVLFEHR